MVVVIADVKKLLPAYQGLTDDQITGAINTAEAYLMVSTQTGHNQPKRIQYKHLQQHP